MPSQAVRRQRPACSGLSPALPLFCTSGCLLSQPSRPTQPPLVVACLPACVLACLLAGVHPGCRGEEPVLRCQRGGAHCRQGRPVAKWLAPLLRHSCVASHHSLRACSLTLCTLMVSQLNPLLPCSHVSCHLACAPDQAATRLSCWRTSWRWPSAHTTQRVWCRWWSKTARSGERAQ